MFGFSRRRMKLGRVVKVQLSDSTSGTRSPVRPSRKIDINKVEEFAPTTSSSEELNCHYSSITLNNESSATNNSDTWMVLSIAGDKPIPRYDHAAVVIGNKMLVVAGDSGNEMLDDVQVLKFDRFTWSRVSSNLHLLPGSLPLKIPACKGHSLVPWGNKALLVGGKTDPPSDKLSVWSFDTVSECWSLVEAKGDIPISRSGHTTVMTNSGMLLFGGEDAKRRKLNDMHMFDLRSLIWQPLVCIGTGPSPRSSHVAALHGDKALFVFGGESKAGILNDLYSLDLKTMLWARIKPRGFIPSPRAASCSTVHGAKWYIVGGGCKKKACSETIIFDLQKLEWTAAIPSPSSSVTTNKGFSVSLVEHKEKDFLVVFGGSKKEVSNQVEVLALDKMEVRTSHLSTSAGNRKCLSSLPSGTEGVFDTCSADAFKKQNVVRSSERHCSGRKSISESSLNLDTSSTPLQKKFHTEEEERHMRKAEDGSSLVKNDMASGKIILEEKPCVMETELSSLPRPEINILPVDREDEVECMATGAHYERKMSNLVRKNGILEGRLVSLLASQETAEKNLASAMKSKQELEKKLTDAALEMEILKDKLGNAEAAQEEATALSNILHTENVRLEHDVAFLKAVLEDTQKELHSTRGMLTGERTRAFELQVEVFHLKQRLQSMENRVTTPRKPYNM